MFMDVRCNVLKTAEQHVKIGEITKNCDRICGTRLIMPRKSKADLGRSLMRKQKRKFESVSSRHTTDLGSSSAATSVSVTETTSVDEFLTNAEAAQRSFEAERGTARIVRDENDDDLTSGDDSNLSDVEEEGSDEDGDGGDDVGSSQASNSIVLIKSGGKC